MHPEHATNRRNAGDLQQQGGKIRNTRGRWLALASLAAALLVMGVLLRSGWHELLCFGPLPLLFAGLVWIVFARPYVAVDDGGIEIANVLGTVRVPWPAVTEVDLRWGLRLVTRLGNFSAWSVPPPARPGLGPDRRDGPGRRDDPSQGTSPAAQLVLDRWHALREAGYLDNPRLETDRPLRRWNRVELGITAALVLLSVAGIAGYRWS